MREQVTRQSKDLAVTRDERVVPRFETRALSEGTRERNGKIVEVIAESTVVEVDGNGRLLVEQDVAEAQVAVDEPEYIRARP